MQIRRWDLVAGLLIVTGFLAVPRPSFGQQPAPESVPAIENELPPPNRTDRSGAESRVDLPSILESPPTTASPADTSLRADASANLEAAAESDWLASTEYGYDIMLRGPIHEAFATRGDGELRGATLLVPQAPPAPVAEQPPEEVPQGNNVQWIRGYWAWQPELERFAWVSGLYRDVPPDRRWVEGYWSPEGDGYRWTPGFWASAGTRQLAMLPEPPQSIDNGPSTPPPTENSFWLPGHWSYVNNDYQWKSGYWTEQQRGWIWQPACYHDTPTGYVFVDGYWDYEPVYRGQLYAPIVYSSALYALPQYRFRPVIRLANTASLLLHLFARSGSRQYYYGDFYGPRYVNAGYYPWYNARGRTNGTIPWVEYYDWRYRQQGVSFRDSMARYENLFRNDVQARSNIQLAAATSAGIDLGLDRGVGVANFEQLVRGAVRGQPMAGSTGPLPQLGSAVNDLGDRVRRGGPEGFLPRSEVTRLPQLRDSLPVQPLDSLRARIPLPPIGPGALPGPVGPRGGFRNLPIPLPGGGALPGLDPGRGLPGPGLLPRGGRLNRGGLGSRLGL